MLTLFFPLALVFAGVALWVPDAFVWARPHLALLLGVIMFGMGLTLTVDDLRRTARRLPLALLGVALQYTVMPLAAFVVGISLQLPDELLAGFVLLGACPGGTASNLIAYLARADIGLSVAMTMLSTLLAPLLTPLAVELLVGARIEVAVGPMMLALAKIVLLPVIGGIVVRLLFGMRLAPVLFVFPYLSMLTIVFVIAVVVALNQTTVLALPWVVMLGVIAHNALGLSTGYGLARLLTRDRAAARTIAIEVGMQNSGLAASLAASFFGATAALPGALFSLWHNLSGVALARHWRGRRPAP